MSVISSFNRLFDDKPDNVQGKIVTIYIVLLAANASVWIWAITAFRDYPLLLGAGLLAYTLGLRHAVDADHIAAIDNVARKLIQMQKQPLSVGLFFSLGHSSVVALGSIFVAVAMSAAQSNFENLKVIGGLIGIGVSAVALLAVAGSNIIILISAFRILNGVKRGEHLVEADFTALLSQRGIINRLLRPLFGIISASWHMYPLGILFGLGFDTASEIGVLGISAAQGQQGLPICAILIFPALFAAGMSWVDTTDGILMLRVYGWAFRRPIRKLYYNITVTLVSVIVALVIGGVEVFSLLEDRIPLNIGIRRCLHLIDENSGVLGLLIIGIFGGCWLVSAAIHRFNGYDSIEGRNRRTRVDSQSVRQRSFESSEAQL